VRILITNDDGIFSKGIIMLAEIAQELGKVTLSAPSGQRSAVSHGITVQEPLVVKEVEYPVSVEKAYSVSGKPADCIRVAMEEFLEEKPDIIISGINAGPNYGLDVFYSGTVSGAVEGMFYGIPSLALSLDGASFDICRHSVPDIVEEFIQSRLSKRMIWNVNIPSCPLEEYKGMIRAPLSGYSQYPCRFNKFQSGEKEWYYFPVTKAVGVLEENTDVDFVKRGYTAITPLTIDFE
jgi:5'-nucleotidase